MKRVRLWCNPAVNGKRIVSSRPIHTVKVFVFAIMWMMVTNKETKPGSETQGETSLYNSNFCSTGKEERLVSMTMMSGIMLERCAG